jgi:16S rRNA (adenine1518-N6/adenine1519-N6)-dimethyltransferase
MIVEIGPGEGALTRYLSPRTRHLIGVEVDPRAVERLRGMFLEDSLTLVQGDFLEYDLASAHARAGRPVRVVGNIPYNITSQILFHVLDHREHVRDATLMMQKEVAERITAGPRTKAYGILSVFCQLFADVRTLFDVSPNAFHPKPRVRSTVLRLVPLERPRFVLPDEEFFRRMVRAVFGKRRKTLRNSLKYFAHEGDVSAIPYLHKRPEELSVEDLVEMSRLLYSGKTGGSSS